MRAQAQDSSSAPSRHELGQFFTPDPLADFMATMFRFPGRDVRLLDAGAGAGALTAALVRRAVEARKKPRSLEVTAYEVDARVIPELESTLADCRAACAAAKITFTASVHREDFIDAAVRGLAGGLFHARWEPRFNAAIVNPPYRKMRSDSDARRLLRSVGVETSNLYTAFLALIVQLLVPGGELVSITPRSFCNGPYFKPFRQLFLREMALQRLHVFESRSALFSAERVLQENIIVHATRSTEHGDTVSVSATTGLDTGISYSREVPYSSVVSESDPDRFIHVAPDESLEAVRIAMDRLPGTLADLGISVSTGRVVDFRAREHLRDDPSPTTVPLIYACHFDGEFVRWPKIGSRKPNAIVRNNVTEPLLIPPEIFVLTKRFSAKEERRRIVACVFNPRLVKGPVIGFENHLNYFHRNGHGLPLGVARGLSLYLNSSLVDHYFRQFNGHTQVNATDLRSLRYPGLETLKRLGQADSAVFQDQAQIDSLIEEHLRAQDV